MYQSLTDSTDVNCSMERGDGVTQSNTEVNHDVINKQDAVQQEDMEIIGTSKIEDLTGNDESFEILTLSKEENVESHSSDDKKELEIVDPALTEEHCDQETIGDAEKSTDIQPELLEGEEVKSDTDMLLVSTEEESLNNEDSSKTAEDGNENEAVDKTEEEIESNTEEQLAQSSTGVKPVEGLKENVQEDKSEAECLLDDKSAFKDTEAIKFSSNISDTPIQAEEIILNGLEVNQSELVSESIKDLQPQEFLEDTLTSINGSDVHDLVEQEESLSASEDSEIEKTFVDAKTNDPISKLNVDASSQNEHDELEVVSEKLIEEESHEIMPEKTLKNLIASSETLEVSVDEFVEVLNGHESDDENCLNTNVNVNCKQLQNCGVKNIQADSERNLPKSLANTTDNLSSLEEEEISSENKFEVETVESCPENVEELKQEREPSEESELSSNIQQIASSENSACWNEDATVEKTAEVGGST